MNRARARLRSGGITPQAIRVSSATVFRQLLDLGVRYRSSPEQVAEAQPVFGHV